MSKIKNLTRKHLSNHLNKKALMIFTCLMMSLLIFSPSLILHSSAKSSLNSFSANSESNLDNFVSPLALSPCSGINFPNPALSTGKAPISVAMGDIDGDGKPDLVVANIGDNTVSVFRNTTTKGSITNSSFAAKVDFPTGSLPHSVAIGDIDGDGKPDLVVANTNGNTVSVLRNTSTNGTISFSLNVDFSTGSRPTSVAIGDLDGDGKLDLAIANGNDNTVSVLRNTSTRGTINSSSFASQQTFPTGNSPESVAIGDIDGDGKLDLVTANFGVNTVSILRNTSTNGNSSFAVKMDFPVNLPESVAIGDLDGDGKLDLAVANQNDNTVSVLRNTSTSGSIGFTTSVAFAAGRFVISVAIGDLDGDGKADLVTINLGSATISVLRNTSTSGSITSSSFAPQVTFAAGAGPEAIAIGDLDGDSKADLAIASSFDSFIVLVLKNTSTSGSITNNSFAQGTFSSGLSPISVAIGDLDGDGKADLAVANYGSNTVSVLRNTSTKGSITSNSFATRVDFPTGNAPISVAIGDLDGDGKADLAVANQDDTTVSVLRNTSTRGVIDANSFAAQVTFPTGQGSYSVAIGDLNGDGKADLAIANIYDNTVSVLGNTSTRGIIDANSFAAQVTFPTGKFPSSVAIGDLDGDGKPDLAIANEGDVTVSVLRNTNTSGSITSNLFATKVDFPTGNFPVSIAIGDLDGDGRLDLATANVIDNTVSVLRNTSTRGSVNFATKVSFFTGDENNPESIAIGDIDGDGKLDLATANISDTTVSVLRNTSTSGSINNSSFATKIGFAVGNNPFSVTIGDLDGDGKLDLAVANAKSNTVSVLRNSCTTSQTIDHNTIYVADTLNNRIQRSTNDGVMWQAVGNGAGVGLGQFNAPRGVTADSTDTLIFVADTNNNRIQRSTDGGKNWSVIASLGTSASQVTQPQAIAYDQSNNILYIADTGNNRILKATNASSTPSFSIMATAGTTVGQFNQPHAIAVDSNGNLYVADTANNRIQKFSGSWSTIVSPGTSLGSVNGPQGVYVDAMNHIYIADTLNNRVQISNTSGSMFSLFMGPGTAAGSVNAPQGVIFAASGNVFIADTGNNRIQKKAASGGTAVVVGQAGLSVGQFNQPSGIR